MADPLTLTAIGMGTSLAGGLVQAKGASDTGAAQQQMFNYRAGVARINSEIDKQNADWTRSQGEIQATQYGIKARQQAGAIRTAQSGSNIDVNSGSNLRTQQSQHTLAGMDLNQIRTNAAKTAYDYDVKSTMDLNQANLDTMAGTNAKRAGDINAMSSIIGTAGSVSSKWLQASQMGVFGGSGSGSIDLYGPDFTVTGHA